MFTASKLLSHPAGAVSSWQISSLTNVDSYDISGDVSNTIRGICSIDGIQVLVVTDAQEVKEYTLSSAWDLSGGVSGPTVHDFSSTLTDGCKGIFLSGDGQHLYLTQGDAGGNNVTRHYALSTSQDISSATLSESLTDSSDYTLGSAYVDDTGHHLFVPTDDSNLIKEYSLSTAYDLSSATLDNSLDTSGDGSNTRGMQVDPSGTYLYYNNYGTIYEYTMSTPLDTTTATQTNSFTPTISGAFGGFFIKPDDATKMLAVDNTNDNIVEYDVTTV